MLMDSAPPIRVLIVDNDPNYRRLNALMLQRYGYSAVTASSGELALEHAAEADVAVVDMMMPGMDGVETIKLLRWNNPHLKIIAASGSAEDDFRPDLVRLGVEVFMAKPFPVEELMEQINVLMESVVV